MPKKQIDENLLWVYPAENPEKLKSIIDEFNIHPVTAQVLVSRGLTDPNEIHKFLYAKLPNLLTPELFGDMDKATERVERAIENKESILIYGDNDVDGISGTTLLVDFFRNLDANVFFYVPNRTSLRSNMILDAFEYARDNNCTLVITVDCGITEVEEVKEEWASKIDTIITDHHEPTEQIPLCVATLNPKLINCTYPNRDLTGVGVAFKLAHALINRFVTKKKISPNSIDLKQYLDLVALGTIADMGLLSGENRILVRYGLQQLKRTKRIGLEKLIKICDINIHEINTTDIASKVAPRLNSLGRIDNPKKGVELLLLKNSVEAEALAQELDQLNIERQRIERTDSEDIERLLEKHPEYLEHKALIIDSDKWHPGIIAIISARFAKHYNRPSIVITVDNGIGKGSIRTIPEFPVIQLLKANSDLLLNYGGHDFAAGLTIKPENIPEFKRRFIAEAEKQLKEQDIYPKLRLDAHVTFKDLTFEFLDSLNLLEPYGTGNPQVILYCEAKQALPPKVVGKKHLKFYLEENDRFLEGIGFNMAHRKNTLTRKNLRLMVAFTPHVNSYLNKSSIQLQIRDFKVI